MKLKLYLVDKGITQTKFAKMVGCHRTHINSIVNGRLTPSAHLALFIEAITNGEIKASSFTKSLQKTS